MSMKEPEPAFEKINNENLYYMLRERGFKTFHKRENEDFYTPEELDLDIIFEQNKKFVRGSEVESINKRLTGYHN